MRLLRGRRLSAHRDHQLQFRELRAKSLNLGILEVQEGHRLEAIELFRRALALDQDLSAEAETHYRMAEVYVSLGKRDRALGHLRTAVTQAPNGRWGKKSEDYLKILR